MRGREKNAVLDLMEKFLKPRKDGVPLQIKSVVILEGVPGYIYVEAIKKVHVQDAIVGISALELGRYKQEVRRPHWKKISTDLSPTILVRKVLFHDTHRSAL